MRLILMRHGIATKRSQARRGSDADRALTAQGVSRVRKAAQGLRALKVAPRVVLTSPYLRARQTAELVAEGLGLPARRIVTSEALLPDAEPDLLYRELRERDDPEALCTGHAPQLDQALALALGIGRNSATELKKAGAAAIELMQWVPPRGRLIWLLGPAALRRLGRAGAPDT